MSSKLFRLGWRDLGKGFLIAVGGALLASLGTALQGGVQSWHDLLLVVESSLGAGVMYLAKNFVTNSQNQLMRKEP